MSEMISQTLRDLLLIGLEVGLFIGLLMLRRVKSKAVAYYETKTSAAEREWLRLVGTEAFHYAERAFAHYDGPAKLNEAVKYVLDRAKIQDMQLTYPEIRAVIEKAWADVSTAK